MRSKSTAEITQKTENTKKQKNNRLTMLDEAPLFADLDDFILIQSVKKKSEPLQKENKKEKKKKVKRQTKQEVTTGSKATPAPKKPRTAPLISEETVLLSVAETCSLLKISRATLVRMDKSGLLPGRIKMGGSVRFHRETIIKWLESLITTNPSASSIS
jgi:excisionase family DNA binding protein